MNHYDPERIKELNSTVIEIIKILNNDNFSHREKGYVLYMVEEYYNRLLA